MTKQDKEKFFPKVNNIKYIEKEISEVEENMDIHKFILSEATDDKDKESTEVIIQIITEDLEHLKQIKDILEAWEVVKKYVKEVSINGIVFEHIINVSHTRQNYEIVKKALEVKDELKK